MITGGGGQSTGGTFISDGTIGQPLAGTNGMGGNFSMLSGFWTLVARKAPFDFDGDGKTDSSVFRPNEENWYALKSHGGILFQNWGVPTDTLTPGDFDGDGLTDVAIWRPSTPGSGLC